MLDKEALARAVAAADAKRDGHDLALLVTSASYMSVAHRIAEAILSGIDRQGYVIVPKVPTEAMLKAGMRADAYCSAPIGCNCAMDIFKAMLAAGDEG